MNKYEYESIKIPQINKKAWQFAFMIKLNRKPELMKKFNKISGLLNKTKQSILSFDLCQKEILAIFGNNWINDVEDIIYFYDSLKFIALEKSSEGSIKNIIKINKFKIPKLNNFNDIIVDYMESKDYLRNIL